MNTPQRPAYTLTKDEALHEATTGALGQLCKRIVAERPDLFPAPLAATAADPARTPDAATAPHGKAAA